MEYAMRIIITVGEQIFCSWLFHVLLICFLKGHMEYAIISFSVGEKILSWLFHLSFDAEESGIFSYIAAWFSIFIRFLPG